MSTAKYYIYKRASRCSTFLLPLQWGPSKSILHKIWTTICKIATIVSAYYTLNHQDCAILLQYTLLTYNECLSLCLYIDFRAFLQIMCTCHTATLCCLRFRSVPSSDVQCSNSPESRCVTCSRKMYTMVQDCECKTFSPLPWSACQSRRETMYRHSEEYHIVPKTEKWLSCNHRSDQECVRVPVKQFHLFARVH